MPSLKFVQNLTDEIRQQLEDLYRHHASFALRQRAHAILLSAKGFTILQLQAIFTVDREHGQCLDHALRTVWPLRFARCAAIRPSPDLYRG